MAQGDAPATVIRVMQGTREIPIGSPQDTSPGGSVTFEANGSYTYVPPGFDLVPPEGFRIETFIYEFGDSDGDTGLGPVDDPGQQLQSHIATDDSFLAVEGGPASVFNFLNDDVLGNAPTAVITTSSGCDRHSSRHPLRYQHRRFDHGQPGWNDHVGEPPPWWANGAVDEFTYTIKDGDGDTEHPRLLLLSRLPTTI